MSQDVQFKAHSRAVPTPALQRNAPGRPWRLVMRTGSNPGCASLLPARAEDWPFQCCPCTISRTMMHRTSVSEMPCHSSHMSCKLWSNSCLLLAGTVQILLGSPASFGTPGLPRQVTPPVVGSRHQCDESKALVAFLTHSSGRTTLK